MKTEWSQNVKFIVHVRFSVASSISFRFSMEVESNPASVCQPPLMCSSARLDSFCSRGCCVWKQSCSSLEANWVANFSVYSQTVGAFHLCPWSFGFCMSI